MCLQMKLMLNVELSELSSSIIYDTSQLRQKVTVFQWVLCCAGNIATYPYWCWKFIFCIIYHKKSISSSFVFAGFEVTRSGMCDGYSWDVSWETKGGDQPLLNVSGEDLQGSEPKIESQFLLDGGTWIRPIRGDMLRHPEPMPQVW